MAWGIFNKIGRGIKKGVDFVGNTVMPVARKVIDAAKPILAGTKFGKIVEKSDDILSYGEDLRKKYGINNLKGVPNKKLGVEKYNSSKLMKPEFEDDEDEEDFE